MQNWLMIGVLFVLCILIFLLLARRGKANRVVMARGDRPRSYRAVAIRAAAIHCSAAKAVYGKRFLTTEAPSIPLPSCDCSTCACIYVHFVDRRRAHQRRDLYMYRAYLEGERKQERRNRAGRRTADQLMFESEGSPATISGNVGGTGVIGRSERT